MSQNFLRRCSSVWNRSRHEVRHFSRRTLQFVAMALVSVFMLAPMSTAGAAPASNLKSLPKAPTNDSQGVTAPVTGKGLQRSLSPQVSTLTSWSVSLSATSTYLWPLQYSTLTATASADVGPTPYYLSIYDATAHNYVKICAYGAVCSVSVTQSSATTHAYLAYVSSYPTTNPPASQQAVSSYVYVTWRGVSVSLSASPTTNWINGASTLTATASADVGPSPFYIEVFDVTSGTLLKVCGFGTTCSVATARSYATTHRFTAYVSSYGTTNPPLNIQAVSSPAYVTWSNTGYRLSLGITGSGSSRTLTAYSNVNVGPTPYYIEIFNLRTNTRVAVCGFSSTCSATVSLAFGKTDFVAFTSSYDTAIPPLNTQASSNVVSPYYFPIFL